MQREIEKIQHKSGIAIIKIGKGDLTLIPFIALKDFN